MNISRLALIACMLLLAACSSSNRPVYSGHEESTKDVPGFSSTGKKLSPHVKLGQSYRINGETYVPRHQPDYVEEGMASWYGPGFHGGKTANGERFDEDELTAAHRTLPLPSIVRVTLISTGKQAYVRVNDRGPFAHNRIIDVSRGVAEKIGLIRSGVGKVRVEYMDNESKKFAELLADGRSPKSIDMDEEVLNANYQSAPTEVARNEPMNTPAIAVEDDDIGVRSNQAAPLSQVASNDLPAPMAEKPASPTSNTVSASPFSGLDSSAAASDTSANVSHEDTPVPSASTPAAEAYVQIGAFQNEANAERLRSKFARVEGLSVMRKINDSGITLYHVRKGPFADMDAGTRALEALRALGADAKIVKH